MNIQEFYDSIDENYENVEKMDYDEILRATHTMKGIASNLEFTQLQQKSAKAVDYDPCRRKGNCIASD